MEAIGIIPARFGSSRFPGKPLALINGKSMIERVYCQASKASTLKKVIVATDNQQILEHVFSFGGIAVMTSSEIKNGTERCMAAFTSFIKDNKNTDFDIIVNIQGDEPFINPSEINTLVNCFQDDNVDIATLIKDITSVEDIFNPSIIKVVKDVNDYALYFSRSPLPYVRDSEQKEWLNKYKFLKHIGIYAYRKKILKVVTRLPVSALEISESLEQLRWLENGYKIKTCFACHESFSIDTPDDLKKVEKLFLKTE